MGCCEDKSEIPTISAPIYDHIGKMIDSKERLIKFTKSSINTIYLVLTKQQDSPVFTAHELYKALLTLDFCFDQASLSYKSNILLLQELKSPQGVYHIKSILICAILLSRSLPSEKSEILFNLYSESSTPTLAADQGKIMVEEMIDMATIKLPNMTVESDKDTQTFWLPLHCVTKYSKDLQTNRSDYANKILYELFKQKPQITKDEFCQSIESSTLLQAFLKSNSLRQCLITSQLTIYT